VSQQLDTSCGQLFTDGHLERTTAASNILQREESVHAFPVRESNNFVQNVRHRHQRLAAKLLYSFGRG
jgi:hypothetical protein